MKRLLCLAMLLLTTGANAESGYSAMGAGTTTCARFNELMAKDPQYVEAVYFSWASGFISGLNSALLLGGRPTHNMQSIPLQVQKNALHGFCSAKPDALYQSGVIQLFGQMTLNPVPQRQTAPPPKH